jgi:hypothetical protein
VTLFCEREKYNKTWAVDRQCRCRNNEKTGIGRSILDRQPQEVDSFIVYLGMIIIQAISILFSGEGWAVRSRRDRTRGYTECIDDREMIVRWLKLTLQHQIGNKATRFGASHWSVAGSQILTLLPCDADASRLPSCDQAIEKTRWLWLSRIDVQWLLRSYQMTPTRVGFHLAARQPKWPISYAPRWQQPLTSLKAITLHERSLPEACEVACIWPSWGEC